MMVRIMFKYIILLVLNKISKIKPTINYKIFNYI
jgi:hypothetical protein